MESFSDSGGLQPRIEELRRLVDDRLSETLTQPDATGAAGLLEAMRYPTLAPGKRIRPLLTLFSTLQFGGKPVAAVDPACAIEIVHTASLVLDDLPCMDNADTRRYQPSAHVAFGEDTAILGAVALLSHAFGLVARDAGLPSPTRNRIVVLLSDAVGLPGLCGGQYLDLQKAKDVEQLHSRKTACLFATAVETGAVVAGAAERDLERARAFGHHLGLAFQILDDLLDATGTNVQAGKPVRADADKETFVSAFGVSGARARVEEHFSAAMSSDFSGDLEEQPLRYFSLHLAASLGVKLN